MSNFTLMRFRVKEAFLHSLRLLVGLACPGECPQPLSYPDPAAKLSRKA